VPKSNKTDKAGDASGYRPIALTSLLCAYMDFSDAFCRVKPEACLASYERVCPHTPW
jgi:hypothetical protein